MHKSLTRPLVGVGVAVLLVGMVSGCSEPSATAPDESPAAVESQSPSASPVDPASLVVVDQIPADILTHGMFELLSRDEQIRLETLHAMSLEAFRAEPVAEQMKYAEFIYRNNFPILEYRLKQSGNGWLLAEANQDTPEGLSATYRLNTALLSTLSEGTPETGLSYDSLTAKKLGVLLTDTEGELGRQRLSGLDSGIDTINVNTPPIVLEWEVEGGKTLETGDVVVTAVKQDANRVQQTFRLETFETIDGGSATFARTILEVSDSDPRFVIF